MREGGGGRERGKGERERRGGRERGKGEREGREGRGGENKGGETERMEEKE